jgi:hypothetical protein
VIVRHFEEIDDPRSEVNRRHLLVDVIVISILGVIAGADGPLAIALWAKMQEPWLREHLALPNGIPSRHTVGRVLQSLKPNAFQQCFAAWLASLHESPSAVETEQESGMCDRTLRVCRHRSICRRTPSSLRGILISIGPSSTILCVSAANDTRFTHACRKDTTIGRRRGSRVDSFHVY